MTGKKVIENYEFNGTKRVLFSARVDRKHIRKLKQQALDEDKKMYMVLEEILEKYFEDKKRGQRDK